MSDIEGMEMGEVVMDPNAKKKGKKLKAPKVPKEPKEPKVVDPAVQAAAKEKSNARKREIVDRVRGIKLPDDAQVRALVYPAKAEGSISRDRYMKYAEIPGTVKEWKELGASTADMRFDLMTGLTEVTLPDGEILSFERTKALNLKKKTDEGSEEEEAQ